MKIYLVGFMGCGKTTIGKRLSARCGFSFIDTDTLFETAHTCTINHYFEQYSEKKFREEEQKILYQTQFMDNAVVAVGGGTPCYQDNMQWMLSNGVTVYIKMPAMALYHRLSDSKTQRPLLSALSDQDMKTAIEKLLTNRETIYNQANIIISGIDFDMEKLVKQLLRSK